MLDLYLNQPTEGPIFGGTKGGWMNRYAADRIIKRLARRATTTKPISPHSLRHYCFNTAAVDAGMPLPDVQQAATHADSKTTMPDRGQGSLDRHAT